MNWKLNYDYVRAAVVAISLVATATFTTGYFYRGTDLLDGFLTFALAIIWFNLATLYMSKGFRDPIYGVFASILAFATVFNIIFGYARIYRVFAIVQASPQAETHHPIDCLYFSIVTFTTLGYGDFYPTEQMRLVAGSEAIMGFFSFAWIVGVIAQTWLRLNAGKSN